jgi:hypothetical protein
VRTGTAVPLPLLSKIVHEEIFYLTQSWTFANMLSFGSAGHPFFAVRKILSAHEQGSRPALHDSNYITFLVYVRREE